MKIKTFGRIGLGLFASAVAIALHGCANNNGILSGAAFQNNDQIFTQQSTTPNKLRKDYQLDLLPPQLSEAIYLTTVKLPGAGYLELIFDRASLPDGSYIEISNGVSSAVSVYRDKDLLNKPVPMQGDTAIIKIILPQLHASGVLRLSHVNYEALPQVLQGEDDRRPLVCYANTDMYSQGLASVNVRHGGTGSGSVVGNGQYLLTNAHVTGGWVGEDVKRGSIWFNWFNQQCDRNSPANDPLEIRLDRIRALGEPATPTDYALVSLNAFDTQHAHTNDLFGSLSIRPKNANQVGEEIYIPQYGNGGLMPEVIGDRWKQQNATITAVSDNVQYNADTQSGSSGSPVISRTAHDIIGLHWGGTDKTNVGVPVSTLQREILPLLATENQPMAGTGQVLAKRLGLPPFPSAFLATITLSEGATISPFPEVVITHHGDYSEVVLDSQNELTGHIGRLRFHALFKNPAGNHDLSAPAANGDELVIHVANSVATRTSEITSTIQRAWLPLKVNSAGGALLQNLIVRLQVAQYDPFTAPFDTNAPGLVKFNLAVPDAKKDYLVDQLITGGQYGYVALYSYEGPQQLVWAPPEAYSMIQLPLKDQTGKIVTVYLRGYRATACSQRAMNASVTCGDGTDSYSKLRLKYVAADNPNVPAGAYDGILPLQGQLNGDTTKRQNVLVSVHVDADQASALPHATISGPAAVDGDAQVVLSGATSTGKELTYAWTGPASIPIVQKGATATFTAPKNTEERRYDFKLVVTDALHRQDEANHQLTVRASASGGAPAWDPQKTYAVPCTKVSHASKTWMNGWNVSRIEPGTEGEWGAWREVGSPNMHSQCSGT